MTFIEFNDNVPNGPDFPADDQTDMLLNNKSTNSIFDVDHYTFENASDYGGYHRKASLIATLAPFVPYSKTSGVLFGFELKNGDNSDTWPSYSNSSVTNKLIIGGRPNTKNDENGYTYLFGNLIMQWGFQLFTVTLGGLSVEFPLKFSEIPFSVDTQIYNPNSLDSSSRALLKVTQIREKGFSFSLQITSDVSIKNMYIYWTAIGLQ